MLVLAANIGTEKRSRDQYEHGNALVQKGDAKTKGFQPLLKFS
jgi:hypothetical protein